MFNEAIASLINKKPITSFERIAEQEIFGYYHTLNLILDSYDAIKLSKNNIHQLHKSLLSKSTKDQSLKGVYRTLPNQVDGKPPETSPKVNFNPTDTYLIQSEMESMIDWTNQSIDKNEIHPLIAIGLFSYEFLAINPYPSGNGNLSRLLTTLLLLQSGYDFVQYASLEVEFEKRKTAYYRALMDGQKNRGSKTEKIDQWILFFLEALQQASIKLEAAYDGIKHKKSYLNERQKAAFRFIGNNEPVKISDLTNSLTAYTPYILKKDVKYLVEEGLIKKIGNGKGTIYIKNKH